MNKTKRRDKARGFRADLAAKELQRQIDFFAHNESDPHGIANAVLASLHCVAEALAAGQKGGKG